MINPFWFKGVPNYGDILTPFILKKIGIKYKYSGQQTCDSLFIGSIAKLARPGVNIYGSGFIRKADPVCPTANWHFVRGPLTRKMVVDSGGKCPQIYGDVALILPKFIKPSEKVYDVGYIPHHVEHNLFPHDRHRVPLLRLDVEKTTLEITKCRKVISSSLHGIIVAHAYGIPAAYVSLSNRLSGDGMKFADYYQSVGLEPVLSSVDKPVYQLPKNSFDTSEILDILKGLIK